MAIINFPPKGPFVFKIDQVVGEKDAVLVTAVTILQSQMSAAQFRQLEIQLLDSTDPDVVALRKLLNGRLH